MPRWLKIILKAVAALLLVLVLLSVSAVIYVAFNKQKILRSITAEISKNLNGTITIQDLSPSFFSGFSGISVTLKGVSIRDDNWAKHRHDLVFAEKIQTSINPVSLLKGETEITRIGLQKARINLYTDSSGYSNLSVFKTKAGGTDSTGKNSSPIRIGSIHMDDVDFTMDNRYRHKLFQFSVHTLRAKMDYEAKNWQAAVRLKAFSHDLSFNTRRGSFIKNQELNGSFQISYDAPKQVISFAPRKLLIGENSFLIAARFKLARKPESFRISIRADEIRWKNAAGLLSANIGKKLNMFDLEKPIAVQTVLDGDFGAQDPLIEVKCQVRDNVLRSPGGTISACNFDGLFTNQDLRSKPRTNANSAIRFFRLKGDYQGVPFHIDSSAITDLDRPIASGTIVSAFDIARLNAAIGNPALRFNSGKADLNLRFRGDIVNYQVTKPIVSGDIHVRNANMSYVPRNLNFRNSSITLSFRDNDLFLKNIRVQSGKSIVNMEGSVRNFLNFYYTDPEKIVVNWKINSPQIYLAEFLGYLGTKQTAPVTKKKQVKTASASDRIDNLIQKSKVNMDVRVNKLFYKRFAATNARAHVSITEAGLDLQNLHVDHAGGSLNVSGKVIPQGKMNRFALRAQVKNVNVSTFFYAFDNFGIESLNYKNLKGFFFSKVDATGMFTDGGNLVPRSMDGTVLFDLKNGALVNFPPLVSVSKIAFRKRGLDNITFSNLNGKFDIRKDKIIINPMRINSSAINMDVAGVYALSRGTRITIDVPLRNPKKDEDIADSEKKRRRRMNGLIVHLVASDEEDGKMKIKWSAGL